MEINDHQSPSPEPRKKTRGKWSGLRVVSFYEKVRVKVSMGYGFATVMKYFTKQKEQWPVFMEVTDSWIMCT